MRNVLVSGLFGLFVVAVAAPALATETNDVACRTHTQAGATEELVLHWNGTSAKGTLHQIAPSGNETTTNVQAERDGATIIADDVFEKDLVTHAAVVRVISGKRYMRTTDAWLACE